MEQEMMELQNFMDKRKLVNQFVKVVDSDRTILNRPIMDSFYEIADIHDMCYLIKSITKGDEKHGETFSFQNKILSKFDAEDILFYIVTTYKKRWTTAEPILMKDPEVWKNYSKFTKRWEEKEADAVEIPHNFMYSQDKQRHYIRVHTNTVSIIAIMYIMKLVESKRKAYAMISQGGVKINGEKIDTTATLKSLNITDGFTIEIGGGIPINIELTIEAKIN